jgi:hypothetical protein
MSVARREPFDWLADPQARHAGRGRILKRHPGLPWRGWWY